MYFKLIQRYKVPKPTKNGRAWYFKFSYKDAFGATKQYRSKRYLTKKEASDAERMFLVTSTDKVEDNNMTFKDLYDEFRMHNDEIMKDTTKYGYDNKEKFIECFYPVKVLLNDLKILYEQDKKEYYGFNDDFFVVFDAKPIADSNIYLRRTKLATLAGLKVIRIHDFRHSCASLLINNGANVTLVAKYLGHTKIEETLNTYSHMFSTALDSVVSVIDNLEDD